VQQESKESAKLLINKGPKLDRQHKQRLYKFLCNAQRNAVLAELSAEVLLCLPAATRTLGHSLGHDALSDRLEKVSARLEDFLIGRGQES
jgi:hypothetical protein